MSYLVIFLVAGFLFIVLLIVWVLRGNSRPEHESALDLPLFNERRRPSQALIDRIFSKEDWEFVCREERPDLRKMFLRERGRVALVWLSEIRGSATALMRFHRLAVRSSVGLKPALELKLGSNYLVLVFFCKLLSLLIRARGPFRARAMMAFASGVADQLWLASSRMVATLNPDLRAKIFAAWSGKSV